MIELEKKNQERKQVIERLFRERQRLKQTLIFSRDPQSMTILSIKIMRINNKVNKLLKLISEDTLEDPYKKKDKEKEKKKEDSFDEKMYIRRNALTDRNIKDELNDINFTNMKEDLKLIDNFLKIQDINFLCKIIDVKTVVEAIKDKPNFYFQREEKEKNYKNTTEFSANKRKFSSLFNKSFRPSGFTRYQKDKVKYNPNFPLTFEDVLYEIEEGHKSNNNNNTNNYKHKQTKTDLFSNNNSTNYNTISFDTKSENFFRTSNKSKSNNKSNNKSKNKTFIKNTNYKNNHNNNINNVNKIILNEKVLRTLNDGNIIKNEIEEEIKLSNQEKKKDKEKVLLKLANKMSLKKQNLKLMRNKKKPILIDEEYFIDRLSKIPHQVKDDFRNTYKKILAEDRILNNDNKFSESYYEQKMRYIREQKYFKEESIKTMHLFKDYKITEKDDENVFKDDKIFDNYGNLLSLEWQLKKKNILGREKYPTGAFNPKQKREIIVHYPENNY
jgi:hypothetical protein